MPLPNSDINGFDEIAVINAGSYFAIYDITTGITNKIKVDLFTQTVEPGQNFTWVSNHEYNIGESVTYGGKWWESLADNNTSNPPSEGPGFWTETSKQTASSLAFHSNGVYTESVVFLMKLIDGFDQLVKLKTATRPYNSSNFFNELAAGDWSIESERGYFVVNKNAHTWGVNTQLTFKGGVWDTFTTGDQKLAIVRQVINANAVIVVAQGSHLRAMTGLAAGDMYYAQADGSISTTNSPDPVFFALTTTTALLLGSGGSGGVASRIALFRFESDLFTEHELSFRGKITGLIDSPTDRLNTVSYQSRLDTVGTWTTHASLAALETWIGANVTGNETTGLIFWIKCLVTFDISVIGLAQNMLTYKPS